MITPSANFQRVARLFCYQTITKYFPCIISTTWKLYAWPFKEKVTFWRRFTLLVKFGEWWTGQWTRQRRTEWQSKQWHNDCLRTNTVLWTLCLLLPAPLPHMTIIYLSQQEKNEPPRKQSKINPASGLFEW